MRRLLAALPLLVLVTAAQAAGGWFKFKDPDGGFSVSVPSQPEVKPDSVTNTDGHIVPMLDYSIDHGTSAMVVIVSDLTQYPDADSAKVIEGAVGGAKGSAQSVVSDTTIKLDGQSGREVQLLDKDGNHIDDKIFFVKLKLYQFMYVLPAKPDAKASADAKRFTRSVHFPRL
jgi:hypothetical protein